MTNPPMTLNLSATVDIAAAEGGESQKKIAIDLYSGGKMTPMGFGTPVVLSLEGIKSDKKIPILAHHDPTKIVGHTTSVSTEGKLSVEGVISGSGDAAREVVETAAAGFPWKASLGAAAIERPKFIGRDESVVANGKTFDGPLWFYERTQLVEASLVPIPADRNTAAKVAAQYDPSSLNGGPTMPDDPKAPETTASGKTPTQTVAAAAGKAEPTPSGDAAPESVQASGTPASSSPPDTVVAAQTEEARKLRAAEIRHEQALRAASNGDENLVATALEKGHSVDWVRAEAYHAQIQAGSPAPAVHTGATQANGLQVVTAAAMTSLGVKSETIEAEFSEPVLEAASRHRGIGLVETIQMAANACGRPITAHHKTTEFIQAAFTTHEIGKVLGFVTQGVVLDSYRAVDPVWRKFCKIGRNEDFKKAKRFRLASGTSLAKTSQQGELAKMKLIDAEYDAKVDANGVHLSLTREDIINDNFDALSQVSAITGRMCGLGVIESVALMLNDASAAFFNADNGNYADGAATALSHESLGVQVEAFMEQKGIDEKVLGMMPKFLVGPSSVHSLMHRLYKSEHLIATGVGATAKKSAGANEHVGQYEPITIPQIGANGEAGGSNTAWFLFPDPAIAAALEVSFLRGIQAPQITKVATPAGFDTMDWNITFDFGVSYQESAAARKVKGAA